MWPASRLNHRVDYRVASATPFAAFAMTSATAGKFDIAIWPVLQVVD
jgi:hypothetical protein